MGGRPPPSPPGSFRTPPGSPPVPTDWLGAPEGVFFLSLSLEWQHWGDAGGDDDTQGHTGGGCNGPLSPAGGEEGEVTIPVPSPPGKDWDRDHPQSPSGGNGRGWGGTTHMDRDKPSVPSPPREGFEGGVKSWCSLPPWGGGEAGSPQPRLQGWGEDQGGLSALGSPKLGWGTG